MSNLMTFPGVAWRSDFQLGCIKKVMGQEISSSSRAWSTMWAFSPHLGCWLDLIYLNLLEATNKKDNSLDKHWQFSGQA